MQAPVLLCAECSASTASKSVQNLCEGHCEHFFQVDNFSPGMEAITSRRRI